MLRLLIVDDEPALLRALVRLAKQLRPTWFVQSASNALEAQTLLSETPFDLLLTDINMPVLTGLELAEWCRAQNFDLNILILSGYSDFEFARDALRLGIRDYLLKPVQEPELASLFSKLEEEIELKRSVQSKANLQKSLLQRPQTHEGDTHPQFASAQHLMFLACQGHRCLQWKSSDDRKQVALEAVQLETFFEGITRPSEEVLCLNSLFETQTILLTLPHSELEQRIEVLDSLCQHFVHTQPSLCLIRSNLLENSTYFPSTQEALLEQLLEHASLFQSHYLTPQSEKPVSTQASFQEEALQFWSALGQSASSSNHSTLKAWSTLMEAWEATNLKQKELLLAIDELCQLASSNAEWHPLLKPDLLKHSLETLLSEATSWTDFRCQSLHCLKDYLQQFDQQALLHRKPQQQSLHALKCYLDAHFAESITSTQLAERFGYTPTYLSALFKNEYGLSPIDYVIDLRIQVAKRRLLEQPDCSQQELAQQLGFSDPSYFSRVFKKMTGLAPSHYRQKMWKK